MASMSQAISKQKYLYERIPCDCARCKGAIRGLCTMTMTHIREHCHFQPLPEIELNEEVKAIFISSSFCALFYEIIHCR